MFLPIAFRALRRALPAVATAATLSLLAVPAANANPDVVRASVEAWLKSMKAPARVDGVQKTPIGGLWEVRLGTDLIYVDDKGRYALVDGQMLDLKANRNLTQERIDELMRIDFADLPLDLALKQVNGNGRRVLAVFEDPNCPHCRNLRRELVKLENATIYTFPYPILSPDSEAKSRAVWCAGTADRMKAWNDLVLEGRSPEAAKSGCDAPITRQLDLGRKLKVSGTPTVFFANGRRIPGGVSGDKLRQLVDENSAPKS